MTRAERWVVIILIGFTTMFVGQIASNTSHQPDPAPCALAPTDHGTIECKENKS